ncbi:MAG: anaerobic ribonucleoside-triphosphate reductase, partial [Halanaerobium sp.]
MSLDYVKKRDGSRVEFKAEKIRNAVFKACKTNSNQKADKIAENITNKVIEKLAAESKNNKQENCPSVEEIQNLVENHLMKAGHFNIAKAYIIYREKHSKIRNTKNAFEDALSSMKGYLDQMDWRVNENSNMSYSLQGLNNFIVDEVTSEHWLQNVYSNEIEKAHKAGDLHIHDLGLLSVYCVGWDLKDLLLQGFRGVPTKTESKAPKHFKSALGQIVNFFFSLQGEA